MDILQHIDSIPDPIVADKARKAIQVFKRTCALYPLEKIAFSFNGGKDSTVLLHLLRAAVAQHTGTDTQDLGGIKSFYFRNTDDFEEVKQFVESSDPMYGLGVEYLTEPDFKRGLSDYLAQTQVMAIVLGTRRGDPNAGGQDVFCPSSDGWPPFMRVNPILDWTYHDVWVFLRAVQVPYCVLYDRGYTSLGGVGNTLPNSALRRSDGGFEPAYHLADGRLERAGRVAAVRKQPPQPPTATATATTGSAAAIAAATPPTATTPHAVQCTNGAAAVVKVPTGGAVVAAPPHLNGHAADHSSKGGTTADGEGGAGMTAVGGAGGGRQAVVSTTGDGGGVDARLTRSAAIVVVGDELLAGKVEDVNARFLCRELRALGWQVVRVVFVPDDVAEIASAVRALAAVVALVITAGGIGPTMDDVTMHGISVAVGQPLVRLPALVSRLAAYFGGEAALSQAHLKLAEAPQAAELIDYTPPGSDRPSHFPLLRVNNIYILPGVPELLRQRWSALRQLLAAAPLAPFHNATLRLALKDETVIAPVLVAVAASHTPDVALGSYPGKEGIIVTLDSKSPGKLAAAMAELTALLPADTVVALERDVSAL